MRTPPGFDVQGHRGARGLAPENTLPAFRRALELGVTTLEMDTVVSADEQVVVSHDPWFSSVFCAHPSGAPVRPDEEADLRIFAMPYARVARFDCGSRGHPDFPRQERQAAIKPLLRDVIRMAEAYAHRHGRPPAFYNVETKSTPDGDGTLHPEPEAFVELLWEVVAREGVADRLTLQSFDVRTLQAARQMRLPIRLSLLVADTGRGLGESLREGVRALGFAPHVYSPDFRLVDAAAVERAHADGMAVIPWTINVWDEMERLQALGVDGLITDYPDLGMRLLGDEVTGV
jgi:glycerophosphoryl diester phosphodiesterase